jgi:CDP-glucose 4,6-dehydratase
MNIKFWKGKNILLTGHTGFKGSWLSLWLQKLGVNLIGYSKDIPTKPSLFELANVKDGMTSLTGDVCNYEQIDKVIRDYKPEIVIHMAAQAILRQSYKDPIETFSTNVIGTVNVLESIRKNSKVRVILNVTSDKCYEPNKQTNGFSEDDRLGGYDPYSNSKACAELVTSSFRNSFFNSSLYVQHGVALASARAGNVIGGGDWGKDRLIPDIMQGIRDNKTIEIRNPEAIRPWQHVLDPLNGYLILIEKLWSSGSEFSEGWNFGPEKNDEKPVKWIIEKLTEQWKHDIRWKTGNEKNPHEEQFLRLDCSKARSRLGWKPKLHLEQGLLWTTSWYKQYEEKNDMREFTEEQITKFQDL